MAAMTETERKKLAELWEELTLIRNHRSYVKSYVVRKARRKKNTIIPFLRVSVVFKTNALYCIQYNLFTETISEGLYDVHLEGKVVEATKTTAGAYKCKRGIPMSDFSGYLGVLTLQQLAVKLKDYTDMIINNRNYW